MEISISQLGNRAVKEEFQILDLIFSELLFYIEKTFKKLDSFYKEIKDLNQQSKFYYLYNWLTNNHYSYDNNSKISDIFDYVFVYFKTKARWRSLLKAKNEILKLTESLKNEMKEQPIQVLPTDNVSNISIKDELQNLKVKIEGLGTFSPYYRNVHFNKSFNKDDEENIPAVKYISFKPSKKLKE